MTTARPVIIVGGGPVGVALAIELGQRGVGCTVLERSTEISRVPKGQNLTQRSLEHFYNWGCVNDLRTARVLPAGFPIGGITCYRNLMSDYWYAPAGLEQIGRFYFQANERLPQYLTEQVLRRRAGEVPGVELRLGATVTAVEQDGGRARVEIEGEDGRLETIEGDYVVGSDGTRSRVREQACIEMESISYDQKMVLAVFRSHALNDALSRFPDRTTFRVLSPEHAGIWQFFGRVAVDQATWFFHGPVERDATADIDSLSEMLEQVAGCPLDVEFNYVGFWDLRIEVARRYRAGRVFIAGDAAHGHPPYGGFGLNTGLEDATNLGWKLAAILGGWGSEALLDSYSEERQPVFRGTGWDVIAGWIEADRAFLDRYRPELNLAEFERAWGARTTGEVAGPNYEPNYEGSSVVFGPPGTPGVEGSHIVLARPGHHLAPRYLPSGPNVYEALGRYFTLLSFDGDDALSRRFEEAASSLGVPLKVVAEEAPELRSAYGTNAVLVRPDQFVAWCDEGSPIHAVSVIGRAIGWEPQPVSSGSASPGRVTP